MNNTENLCNVDTNMIQFTVNDQTFLAILLAEISGEINHLFNFQEKENAWKRKLEKGILELEKN